MNNNKQLTLLCNKLLYGKKSKRKITIKRILKWIKRKIFLLFHKCHNLYDGLGHEDILPSIDLNYKTDKKIVIYSCVSGNYDSINSPMFINENVDYILFVDDENVPNNSYWKLKKIPEKLKKYSPSLKNRYIKMHPNELFPDYDYSIYIDGNVIITGDILPFIDTVNTKTGLAIHTHSLRNCLQDEFVECVNCSKGNKKMMKKQIKKYYDEGFPKHFGIYECNVIFTQIGENSKSIYEMWWKEFCDSQSNRDQFSLPYVIWKMKYKFNDVGYLGNNIYMSPYFIVLSHNSGR